MNVKILSRSKLCILNERMIARAHKKPLVKIKFSLIPAPEEEQSQPINVVIYKAEEWESCREKLASVSRYISDVKSRHRKSQPAKRASGGAGSELHSSFQIYPGNCYLDRDQCQTHTDTIYHSARPRSRTILRAKFHLLLPFSSTSLKQPNYFFIATIVNNS